MTRKSQTEKERGEMFQLYFSSYYFVLHFGLYLEVAKAMRNLLKPMKEDESLNSVGQPLPSIFPFQFSLYPWLFDYYDDESVGR